MKSKTDELTEKAFYHAMNFFKHNDRGVDNQRACVKQLMEITGFDFDTCLKIQNPVLSLGMAVDTIGIGESVIKNNLQMVTQSINNHLLNLQINHIQKPIVSSSFKSIAPHDYSGASQEDIDKHFVMAYDNSNKRLDINSFLEKGDFTVRRTVEHLDYLAKSKGKYVLYEKKYLNFSFNLMRDESIATLSKFLHSQELNLIQLNLSYNTISDKDIEPLFYDLRNDFNVSAHQIQIINLSNNNIGDYGSHYISQSLISGRYPNLRCLDVSGNPITQKSYVHFAESFKSDTVKEMVVILKIANTLPEIKEFFSKGFKYYINEIDKYVSNFPTNKIRSNIDADKWKECKELGGKVGKSMVSGFVKGILSGKKEAIAVYMAEEAIVDNLLTPEAFYCYIDTKELVGDILDQSCTIF